VSQRRRGKKNEKKKGRDPHTNTMRKGGGYKEGKKEKGKKSLHIPPKNELGKWPTELL